MFFMYKNGNGWGKFLYRTQTSKVMLAHDHPEGCSHKSGCQQSPSTDLPCDYFCAFTLLLSRFYLVLQFINIMVLHYLINNYYFFFVCKINSHLVQLLMNNNNKATIENFRYAVFLSLTILITCTCCLYYFVIIKQL